MAEPTAYAVAQMFSQLTGREVSVSLATRSSANKNKQIYGVYSLAVDKTPLVVSADIELIGSLGGALVGLPYETVVDQIQGEPLEEALRDAMHEILNIASTIVITDTRAVFQSMHTNPVYMSGEACDLLKKPWQQTHFDISIDGYTDGTFTIMYAA